MVRRERRARESNGSSSGIERRGERTNRAERDGACFVYSGTNEPSGARARAERTSRRVVNSSTRVLMRPRSSTVPTANNFLEDFIRVESRRRLSASAAHQRRSSTFSSRTVVVYRSRPTLASHPRARIPRATRPRSVDGGDVRRDVLRRPRRFRPAGFRFRLSFRVCGRRRRRRSTTSFHARWTIVASVCLGGDGVQTDLDARADARPGSRQPSKT